MKKIVRTIVLVLLTTLLCFSAVFAVSAEETIENGFVEFETDASINFEEIIEVVLTNVSTGDYYTQRLYRINDYATNISIPLGCYSVSAQVLDITGEELSHYNVALEADEVEVTTTFLAEVIYLEVEEFASGDVSSGNVSSSSQEEGSSPTEFALVTEDDTCPEPGTPSQKEEKPDRSVLSSLFITFVVFIVGALIFYFVKKKQNS